MVQFCNIVTLLWLGYWTILAGRCVMRGIRNSLLFVFPIHFLFCGLPLLFDFIWGVPYYERFPGFAEAANHQTTCLVYCAYVAICPVFWWIFLGPFRTGNLVGTSSWLNDIQRRPGLNAALVALLAIPLLITLISSDPKMYLFYSPFARQWQMRDTELIYHAVIVKFIQLGVLAAAAILLRSRHVVTCLVWIVPFLVINCWLHGKRNIVAFTLFLVLYAIWRRGVLRGQQLVLASATVAALFVFYSVYYQTNLRFSYASSSNRSYDQWLEGVRIDFGRDDVIKLNLFTELHPHIEPILEYRGESIAVAATFFVPRWIWSGKPESYAARVMTAAMGRRSPGGGTMTTNVLAETIANCGWLGLLVGPMVLVAVCRLGDWCNDEVMQLLTLFIAVGMTAVSFSYWAHVMVIWLGMLAYIAVGRSGRLVHQPVHSSVNFARRPRPITARHSLCSDERIRAVGHIRLPESPRRVIYRVGEKQKP